MKYSIFISAILITWMGTTSTPLSFSWHSAPPAVTSANAECKDFTLNLDVNGQARLYPADIDDGSTGDGTLLLGLSDTIFDCSDRGVQVVTLTVSDDSTNDNCTASVSILDPIAPTAICKNITLQLDETGEAIIAPSDVDGGSYDACGIMLMSLNRDDFTCTDVSPFSKIVSLSVMDSSQNTAGCQALVKVEDNIAPDVQCNNLTLELDELGGAKIDVSDVDAGSSDACGIASMVIDRDTFTCNDISQFSKIVTLQVVDIYGNGSSCQALIQVIDARDPVAKCKDITVYLDAQGAYPLSVQEIDEGSSDNCGISSLSIPPTTFSCASTTVPPSVMLTVTDNYAHLDSCEAFVIVEDTLPPHAACQDLTVYLDATGSYSLVASEIEAGSTDNCGIDEASIATPPFDCNSTSGPIRVTLKLSDIHENEDSCIAQITVRDTLPPVAHCQPITVFLDATGSYMLTASEIENGSSDNCGIAGMAIPPSSFDCNSAPASVQLTVTDVHGNIDACTAQITIQDTLLPTAQCQDITVYLDAAGAYTLSPSELNNNSMDNCGAAQLNLSISPSSFDCSHIGNNSVDLTITDASNNTASCQANVTVIDSTAPDAICQNLTIQLDSMGMATIVPSDIDNGSNDACGIQTPDLSKYAFDCTDLLNSTQNLTLTVTDVNNNTSSCQAVVLIQDTIGPVVTCSNITVFLDSMGQTSIVANDVGMATDNCEVKNTAIDQSNFNCSQLGNNAITYAAEDSSGNLSSCNPQVEVKDTLSPIIRCPIDEVVPADANCQAILIDFTTKVSPTDNCTALPAVSQFPPINSLQEDTTLVTLTATDGSNNATSCSFRFIVVDETPPTVTCKNIQVELDSTGKATITPDDVTDRKMDNCTDANMLRTSLDRDSLDCLDAENGVRVVVLTVIDASDNTNSCQAWVSVDDNIAPLVQCVDTLEMELDDIELVLNGVTMSDNCAIVDVNFSPFNIDCSWVATYTPVTVSIEDRSNNVTSCTIQVYVKDTVDAQWLTRPPNIIRCGEQLIDWDEPTARFPCDRTPLVSYTSQPAGLVKEGAFPVGITQIFYELEDVLVKNTLEDAFQIEILPIPIITNYATGDEFVASSLEEFEILPEADVEGVSYLWELQLSEFLEASPALPVGITAGPLVQTFSFTDARSVGEAKYRITPVFADSCIGESVDILVKVLPGTGTFFVPEMFTPNGDGFNDDWGVQLLKDGSPDDFRIMVFNQAGGKMFSSVSLSNRWTGGNCPDGPYWYVIERKDTGERVKTGGVTIQR